MEVYRGEAIAAVVFDMFTAQEGRSDLTLEVDLQTAANGTPLVRFRDLHVM
jgi:hypothetical protein